ncbi:hypothetical protein OG898_28780 [Streptomyces sp. NBC_00193]|uniref:hypothetical protein n=1 Tax=unclassified Streptomyces TaxID=2593676 RepID=UPI0022519270|nr:MULTISPECIES: hypothetical protein [unclassified Streptomyces]MCX5129905.1 hypothetical protein [Streptomyces sp. NBC_00347]MCX5300415.1 hypothetical protein [Streptomyces sp. NBC_00193]
MIRTVDAIDPEPAMLAEGRRIADERGLQSPVLVLLLQPHVLGAKRDEFERCLRDALPAFDPIRIYRNTVQIECTIATRN